MMLLMRALFTGDEVGELLPDFFIRNIFLSMISSLLTEGSKKSFFVLLFVDSLSLLSTESIFILNLGLLYVFLMELS